MRERETKGRRGRWKGKRDGGSEGRRRRVDTRMRVDLMGDVNLTHTHLCIFLGHPI